MHDQPFQTFELRSSDPAAGSPVLTGVQIRGRLDAVLLELTLRQTYRNPGDAVLEVVYTFPLPAHAVLLGFASELNGERRDGAVVARQAAEQRYEGALAEGHAPVMLEAMGNGLHTANIGNLKPGDQIVLECRYAQLLVWEQGRLRVSLPTTVAPRYGTPAQAGLQPQQVPAASLDVEYPLDLAMTIGPALAGATVTCPTHAAACRPNADGSIALQLDASARMDRDVVVVVTPRELQPSLLVQAHDAANNDAPVVRLAALTPASASRRESVALKVVVDCSGSMQGDSIASASAALRGLAVALTERDRLSLTRYGSTVEHVLAPTPAGPTLLPRLQPLIDGLQADLGGTETAAALRAAFELPVDPVGSDAARADVLLITDGAVWNAVASIEAARLSGHRIFAIGVGSAPAEGFLRTLAESTGGACEFATPGEALAAAAQRMLERMRQHRAVGLRVDWGAEPVWSTGPGVTAFGGDTVIALAGFAAPPAAGMVKLLADDAQGQIIELARSEADAPSPGDSLARLAAARRLPTLDAADAPAHAVRYQLLSPHTNCILVHERVQAERAAEAARLHAVPSMLAAAWGGFGSAEPLRASRPPMQPRAASPMRMRDWAAPDFSAPDFFNGPASHVDALVALDDASLERLLVRDLLDLLVMSVRSQLIAGDPVVVTSQNHHDIQHAIDEAVSLGATTEQAWLLLARWASGWLGNLVDPEFEALVEPLVNGLDTATIAAIDAMFEAKLGSGRAAEAPVDTRSSRLARTPRWP